MKSLFKKITTAFVAIASIALMAGGMIALPVQAEGAPGGLKDGIKTTKTDDMPDDLTGSDGIINTVINTMLFIVGILSVIMIIYAGIRYATAHGDKGQVESAKNTLIYAIVGLVVSILAYALVNWVTGLFA